MKRFKILCTLLLTLLIPVDKGAKQVLIGPAGALLSLDPNHSPANH